MMWKSDAITSQHSPPAVIPHCGHVIEYSVDVSGNNDPWDIFQQALSGSNDANNVPRLRPHISFVFAAESLPAVAEGLAWESRSNDVNQPRICVGVPVTDECSDIAEDGGVLEHAVPDSGGDDSLTVVVELDIAYRPPAEQLRPEKPTAGAAEE